MPSPVGIGRRPIVLLLAAVLAVSACTDGDEPMALPSASPSPTPEVTAAPSPSHSPADPFAVPDEITAEYVERVLNEIARLDADLTREILRRPLDEGAVELPPEDRAQLEAIFAEPILTFNTRATTALLRQQDERDDLVPPDEYGQLRIETEEVLASDDCIVARIVRDFSETDAVRDEFVSALAFVFLRPAPEASPTNWQLASLLESDIAPGSEGEEELRALTANDLSDEVPEVCR